MKKNYGDVIKQLRLEVSLSQGGLAEAIGYESATAISLIEANKRSIDLETFEKILKVCGYKLEIKRTPSIIIKDVSTPSINTDSATTG